PPFFHTSPSLEQPRPRRNLRSLPTRRSSDLKLFFANLARQPGPEFRSEGGAASCRGFTGDREQAAHGRVREHPARCRIRRGFIPDRKSTRLNSSHVKISYAVFCLKKQTDTKK